MDKESDKKRAGNFTQPENDLLQSLVQKYWPIIENKKSDRCTWQQKNECWILIAEEFNCLSNSFEDRSADVLHRKWDNMKKILKQKVSTEKKHLKVANELPTKFTTLDEKENEIISLLIAPKPEKDCDKIVNEISSNSETDEYIPMSVKKRKLSIRKSTPEIPNKKVCNVPDKNVQICELQLQLMKEEHTLKMSIMQKEYEQRMKIITEEHELKMNIMNLELIQKRNM